MLTDIRDMKRVLDFDFESLRENEFAAYNTDADTGIILNDQGAPALTDDEKRLYVFDGEVSARNFIEARIQQLKRATVWILYNHTGAVVEKFFDEELYNCESQREETKTKRKGFRFRL